MKFPDSASLKRLFTPTPTTFYVISYLTWSGIKAYKGIFKFPRDFISNLPKSKLGLS